MLALAASVRSGRAQVDLPQLHGQATNADRRLRPVDGAGRLSRTSSASGPSMRCAPPSTTSPRTCPATAADGAEWARRSLVVQFFNENIGGDRFWQLVDDMLVRPAENPT